jgi:hypothetical protein
MSRIIREHRVYGKEVIVRAATEEAARMLVRAKAPGMHIWEIELNHGSFEDTTCSYEWVAYVAFHEDCFALND